VWDKLRQSTDLQKFQLSNLAKFTTFLVQQRVQSLGILKVTQECKLMNPIKLKSTIFLQVIEFSEMNKPNVRFLREVLTTLMVEGYKDEVGFDWFGEPNILLFSTNVWLEFFFFARKRVIVTKPCVEKFRFYHGYSIEFYV
jgi:hypothetical protein